MGTSPSLISELDTAIQSSSSDKRIATLRRVTDLFLSHAGQYDPAQMKLFDGVLMRMIGHIETRALAELGERLAPIDGAPGEVIRHLAKHDEIVVAYHRVHATDGRADFRDVLFAPRKTQRVFDAAFDGHDLQQGMIQQPFQFTIDDRE